ncbi:MAG: multiheme c-type cytochrome [Alphaproteobacteria bacterium]|nr:multiheme c-type cytochrome [Alphaproteobacteria bacterium]
MFKHVIFLFLILAGVSLAGNFSPLQAANTGGDKGKAAAGAKSGQSDDDDLLKKDDDDDDDKDSLLSKDDDDDDDKDSLLSKDDDDDDEEDKKDEIREVDQKAAAAHDALFAETRYPSAGTCGTCHPKQYREWSVSQHAYSQLSPVYLSLNNKINELANGSNGDFCLRCHNQVGANLGENSFISNLDRHPTSREGITCVVCHRIDRDYNKASGRLALVEGGLTEAVYGPAGNAELARVLENTHEYRVVTDPKEPGRKIHKEIKQFTNISQPVFCGTCHDVTLFNGFRLEEAYSEYRLSPAAARGETCQDCHMGKVQGVVSGYETGPAAVVGGVPSAPRKLTNHFFAGPDYSVIHPGIFPHNAEAQQMATLAEWLQFDVAAGWGTDKFEDNVPEGHEFPERWRSIDDRYDAREILNTQFERLEWARQQRLEVLRNGYVMGKIITKRADRSGIEFQVQVKNGTDGHNVPTGFSGERLVWLDVTVTDREGTVVFRSGDRDPNGDLRDGHSAYVHAGEIELDPYLFSLQSIFVTQNGRGGEIEHVIPIPYPVTALPRVLPSAVSLVFTGEPPTERNHKMGIEPNGQRWAPYEIAGDALTGKGPYRADIKLISQPAPVNLLVAMQSVGFDYGITPRQAGDALVAGAQVLWQREVVFDVK